MFEQIFEKVSKKVSLTAEEQIAIKKYFIPKKIRKKQFFLLSGELCKYVAFVNKGLLRSYISNEKGIERTVQFAFEGKWITDYPSFLSGSEAVFNIEVLENAELLLLEKDNHELLLNDFPILEKYFRMLLEENVILLQRRLINSISLSAEEKYQKFLEVMPEITQRVPQHMVASYLGITPETLSRVRKQLSKPELK